MTTALTEATPRSSGRHPQLGKPVNFSYDGHPSAAMPMLVAADRIFELSPEAPERVADYLRAIGQVTRLHLIVHLGEHSATAVDLAQRLGQSHANITRHLQTLYALGLANRRLCDGRFVYSLRDRSTLELVCQLAARLS